MYFYHIFLVKYNFRKYQNDPRKRRKIEWRVSIDNIILLNPYVSRTLEPYRIRWF